MTPSAKYRYSAPQVKKMVKAALESKSAKQRAKLDRPDGDEALEGSREPALPDRYLTS